MGVYVSMENGTVSREIVHQLTVLIRDKGCAVWSVKVSLHGCLCVNGKWDCVGRDCPLANCPNPGQGMCCIECEGKLTWVFMCQWRMGLCQERLSTN